MWILIIWTNKDKYFGQAKFCVRALSQLAKRGSMLLFLLVLTYGYHYTSKLKDDLLS